MNKIRLKQLRLQIHTFFPQYSNSHKKIPEVICGLGSLHHLPHPGVAGVELQRRVEETGELYGNNEGECKEEYEVTLKCKGMCRHPNWHTVDTSK